MTPKKRWQDAPPLIWFLLLGGYNLLVSVICFMNHHNIDSRALYTLRSFYLGIDEKRSIGMNECSELTLPFRIFGGIIVALISSTTVYCYGENNHTKIREDVIF